jgi:hypothetical protein
MGLSIQRLSSMIEINNLLNRLQKVRKIGTDEWVASSPTRSDRTPSLFIKYDTNGNILLHDFGGSSVDEICNAIGIELSDLFPDDGKEYKPQRFNAHNVLTAMRQEVLLVALCAVDIVAGRPITEEDKDRVLLASQRLKEVYELCLG